MLETKEKGECSCGRSPVGKRCVGWHMLTEKEYQKALAEYNKMPKNQQHGLYHAKAIDGLGE